MPQSLKVENIESYKEEYDDKLICFADKEIMNKNFLLGIKLEEDEALHTIMMQEKLCPENCEMVDYIRDKISGELNNRKIDIMKPLSYFIKVDIEENGDYIFDWNEIQW